MISIDPVHFQFVPTPGTSNDTYFSTDSKMLRKFGSCFDFSRTEDEACVFVRLATCCHWHNVIISKQQCMQRKKLLQRLIGRNSFVNGTKDSNFARECMTQKLHQSPVTGLILNGTTEMFSNKIVTKLSSNHWGWI